MTPDRQWYSRYQILCAEREAWNDGDDATDEVYFYDGISFWRRTGNGKRRLLPSWRTPTHGWRHDDGCDCDLCAQHDVLEFKPLSVA